MPHKVPRYDRLQIWWTSSSKFVFSFLIKRDDILKAEFKLDCKAEWSSSPSSGSDKVISPSIGVTNLKISVNRQNSVNQITLTGLWSRPAMYKWCQLVKSLIKSSVEITPYLSSPNSVFTNWLKYKPVAFEFQFEIESADFAFIK